MSDAPRPYQLDCEHKVYFRAAYAPTPGEIIYCPKCKTERKFPDIDPVRGTYYLDAEWKCYRISNNKSRGICYRNGEGCGYEYTAAFTQLRTRMEKHYRRGCNHDELDVKIVPLPRNSPPPF